MMYEALQDYARKQESAKLWYEILQESLEFSKQLLSEAKVAVSPGIGFGSYGEGYVRFSLCATKELLINTIGSHNFNMFFWTNSVLGSRTPYFDVMSTIPFMWWSKYGFKVKKVNILTPIYSTI